MANPIAELDLRLRVAIERALGPEFAGADPVLRASSQPQFGDYQCNAAMALGKRAGRPPREVAEAIVASFEATDLVEPPGVAGPGFINLRFTSAALAGGAEWVARDSRLGVPMADPVEKVVVDYSSPNLAKELHLGHLRSTIIGDCLARVLSFVGHDVIRQNHFGEWGTQFGMLIEHFVETGADVGSATLSDLNAFYREANERFNNDATFADRARSRVVSLQSGDEESLALWRRFVDESTSHARAVYSRLGVLLEPGDDKPESSYNEALAEVASEIERLGVAVVDDGALVVFSSKYEAPLLVRKRDGGFMYGTTDLAAIRHRVEDLGATLIVYVVGAPQSQHLEQVFEAARAAGWLRPPVRAVHVAFGSVLDQDRKMYKTRTGENIKLNELLDEAVVRAAAKVAEANPDLSDDEQAMVARMIGIGAVKYADLANDRIKDYVFDWDRMLAFEGNTGPYLQYAHARIKSIFRRVEGGPLPVRDVPVLVGHDAERALVLQLLDFGPAVASVVEAFQPHRLCTYLFDLAQAFTAFYEACPVLRAESEEVRRSRLVLCDATARVLACGLGLLGIEAPERM